MIYLAFDIGCIECGEDSAVIGVYATEAEAQAATERALVAQRENWSGQHYFEVYPIEGANLAVPHEEGVTEP